VKEIATIKMADLNTDNMDKAILIISGTCEKHGDKSY
jgi:ribosomal protein L11